MRADCEGCVDCCIDWRPVAPTVFNHGRRGPRTPLNDTYSLVPLIRDEAHDFVEVGFGNTLSPRLWEVPPGEGVEIDGVEVAAVDGKLAFFVGMHKPPKPVALSGLERTRLRACVFLNPETLQCRIHDTEFYPGECAEYPGYNFVLEQETECECVERHHGGERLLDDAAPDDLHGLLLGPHALGAKLFVHPEPERLAGTIDHLKRRELTPESRAEFVDVAVGSHPGSTKVDGDHASWARAETPENEPWTGEAVAAWDAVAGRLGSTAGGVPGLDEVEVARGTPETPGRDAVRDDG